MASNGTGSGITGEDTFPKLLLHHAKARGSQPAIREKTRGIWRTLTWRELADEVAAIAAALSARGLKRGAHMAFIGDNRPRLQTTMCAAHALGAVVVPLFQDATSDELLALLQGVELTHVFAEDQEQVDKLLTVLPQLRSIVSVVYDKDRGMRHYRQPQLVSYTALLTEGRDRLAINPEFVEAEAALGSGANAASLLFTPGTSGRAKGVVLTHAALIDRARSAAATDSLTDKDVALVYLPPAWIGQKMFGYAQPLVVGYSICCPESSSTMFADIREIGPTYFLAPPSVLEAMWKRVASRMEDAGGLKRILYRSCMRLARRVGPRILSREPVFIGSRLAYAIGGVLIYGPLRDVLGLSRVRVAYTSGEAVAPEVLTFFRSIGINLKQLYGTAETGFFVAMQRDGQVRHDTVGHAANGVEIKLSPEREVLVRSAGLFKEYHRDPEATAQAMTSDGWFRTGDAGHVGDDGHLSIIDRVNDIGSLRDGTQYAPKIIENTLKMSPYVKEAVAFGGGRDAVTVLIDIDTAAVGSWASKRGIAYTGRADLASREEVYRLIGETIASANAAVAKSPVPGKSQIRRFAILHEELDADDGMLTRMRTLRRAAVSERYAALIEAMYAGGTGANVVGRSNGPGRSDGTPAQIRIADVTSSSSANSKTAA